MKSDTVNPPKLSPQEQNCLTKLIKIGIYKELHRKKLIHGEQLNALILQNQPQSIPAQSGGNQ